MHYNTQTSLKIKCTEKCSVSPYTTFLLSCLNSENFTGKRVCDFGCGTGVIGLNIRALFDCEVIGLDIIPEFVELSRNNAAFNRLDGCMFNTVEEFKSNLAYQDSSFTFDCIISNPASIPSPLTAKRNPFIDGGPDGDKMLIALFQMAKFYLKKNGQVLFLHTSLAPLNKTLQYLDRSGYEICIERVTQLEFRDQYKSCEQHLECLRDRNLNFFFGSRGKQYELVYFIRLKNRQ